MEVIADTTVLIDLWRYRKTPRRLGDLTAKVGEAAILIPWITQAEFSRGALFKDVSPAALAEFYASFHYCHSTRPRLMFIADCGWPWHGRVEHPTTRTCGLPHARWQQKSLS